MIQPGQSLLSAMGADPILDDLIEGFAKRLHKGERVDPEAYAREHPERGEELRRILPAMLVLADLACSARDPLPSGASREGDSDRALGELGDFRILREIGRGGMGVVYEAVQISLGRRVALKVLPFAAALDAKQLQRFKNEAQAAAHLQHTNIVPVYAVGCERGVHFYAMQFIDGQTLAALIQDLRQLAGLKPTGTERSAAATGGLANELVSGRWLPVQQRGAQASWSPLLAKQVDEACDCFEGAWKAAAAASERPCIEDHLGALASPERLVLLGELVLLDVHYRRLHGEDPQPADYAGRFSELDPERLAGAVVSRVTARPHHPAPSPALAVTPPIAALSTERSTKSAAFFRTVAHLGVQAAEALEHAHQMGVIHRDIKPANLLVDAEGRMWITDFGLAHCHSQPGLTMTGDMLGTLRYMSPEQALAKRGTLDARTDVYSLGVTLYELLALEPAYNGRDREELLRQIAFEEPRSPRRLWPAVPAELETIVLKAMAKTPEERYPTAQELADDLERYLKDEPIRARRPRLVQRVNKWARRKPAVAALFAVSGFAAVLLFGLVFGLVLSAQLRDAIHDEQVALAGKEAALKKAEEFRYLQHITLASTALRESNTGWLEQLLDDCPPDYHHRWEWQYFKRQCHAELHTLEGHPNGGIRSLAFSPDGKRLATASLDGTVKIWDTATGQEERTLRGHKNEVMDVVFSPDGIRLASGGWDGSIRLWDAATGRQEQTLEARGPVWSVAFSPDGTRLAFGADRTVQICDAATGREVIPPLKGHTGPRLFVTFSPDGKRLASAGYDHDQMVKLWDTATGLEEHTFRGHADVFSVAFSPDGKRLAGASDDRTVKVWDVATHREVFSPLQGHAGGVVRVAFSPDGKRLASAGYDKTVKVWDAATAQETLSLSGHANVIFAVAFSPDGTRLASASQDRTVKFWDITTSQEERTLKGHHGPVAGVAFSPDGKRLASAGTDGTVRLWHAATGQEERPLEGHHGPVAAVAFAADASQLASAGADKTVKIWDVKAGRVIRDLDHAGQVRSVAFSPDGKWLASADAQGTLKLWEAVTGREVHGLRADGDGREVRSVAFSADGSQVATASADRVVKVWDTATGQRVHTLQGHLCWVHCVAFSPDLTRFASASEKRPADEHGRPQSATQLASASGDGSVQIWDAITGEHVRSIQGHGNYVRSVAFSRDGSRLASAAGFVRFWDVLTGQEVLSLKGHSGDVLGLAFSPDGTRLASAGQDGTIRVWDARPLTPQMALEREALALLDFLFARPLGMAEVEEFLHDSQTIRPEVREKALAWVAQYHQEQDPKRYHQASWDVVRQPYLNVFQYHLALRQAEMACRLGPKEESYRSTLGVAQYRARRFQDALATLTRPEQPKQDVPAGLAFLAMTQYRLDEKEQAMATMVRLRQVLQEPGRTPDAEIDGFAHEAEALIQSR